MSTVDIGRASKGRGWSGRRESNPRLLLGRQGSYHYTTPALQVVGIRSRTARQGRTIMTAATKARRGCHWRPLGTGRGRPARDLGELQMQRPCVACIDQPDNRPSISPASRPPISARLLLLRKPLHAPRFPTCPKDTAFPPVIRSGLASRRSSTSWRSQNNVSSAEWRVPLRDSATPCTLLADWTKSLTRLAPGAMARHFGNVSQRKDLGEARRPSNSITVSSKATQPSNSATVAQGRRAPRRRVGNRGNSGRSAAASQRMHWTDPGAGAVHAVLACRPIDQIKPPGHPRRTTSRGTSRP